MTNKKKLITIIGSTATGKSDLAVQLAKYRDGHVLNADSIQVYKGLDVISNKISESEQDSVKHHMMSFLDKDKEYSIPQFIADSGYLVDKLSAQKTLPVVAGGTHYYIHHLIFQNNLIKTDEISDKPHSLTANPHADFYSMISPLSSSDKDLIMALPSIKESQYTNVDSSNTPLYSHLHRILSLIDPVTASRWHLRDFRKVKRSLDIIWENGRKRSDIEQEQKASKSIDALSQTKYKNLVFWVYTDPDTLSKRLERRVEKMTEVCVLLVGSTCLTRAPKQGLLNEIEELRALENAFISNGQQDYTRGLFQAIGYKEFDAYFKATTEKERDEAFKQGLELMKIGTRRYAMKQLKWIQNKLLPEIVAHQKSASSDGVPSSIDIYMVDSSDISRWDEMVVHPAKDILDSELECGNKFELTKSTEFLNDEPLPDPKSYSEVAERLFSKESKLAASNAETGYRKITCGVCTNDPHNPIVLNEGMEYENHLSSKAHKAKTRKPTTKPTQEEIERLRKLKNRV
ncbi:hypothetical protein E3P77_01166 [Wallemia ichthyophaga]|uniref:tRNA dimethylallyltransferase n=1 Tax=Wallemia ichthyophaga TaxID=245174 RepID=A0A4T0F415_WALIC|nr:hypothetical protein E3P91_01508 [Wallemia ichthyophaga]TIA81484.1 hypothetical protein E3P98_02038 [Wallemia ichthyophaga]TIA96243.1 hypothetical protein E3P95_03345 [Wallemia ichthyophaga]TIA99232.1 hypothetical protein E3P94_02661 [Wallemia ichthyophaga]TIB12109.1 hypothetical protein E3P90_02194 [Wallemia ichthyophaga]